MANDLSCSIVSARRHPLLDARVGLPQRRLSFEAEQAEKKVVHRFFARRWPLRKIRDRQGEGEIRRGRAGDDTRWCFGWCRRKRICRSWRTDRRRGRPVSEAVRKRSGTRRQGILI